METTGSVKVRQAWQVNCVGGVANESKMLDQGGQGWAGLAVAFY
jgi:hypothetical protein